MIGLSGESTADQGYGQVLATKKSYHSGCQDTRARAGGRQHLSFLYGAGFIVAVLAMFS